MEAAKEKCEKCRDFLLYDDEQPRGLCWRCDREKVRREMQTIIDQGVKATNRFSELVDYCHQRQPKYGWHDLLSEARKSCDRSSRSDLAQVLDHAANTELKDFELADWRREYPEARVSTKPPELLLEASPQIALRVGERVPAVFADELRKCVTDSGDRDRLAKLIEICKAYDNGRSTLARFHQVCDSRWHALKKDLEEAIKNWQPPQIPPGWSNEKDHQPQASGAADEAGTRPGFWKRLFGAARPPEDELKESKAGRSDTRHSGGSNWYFVEDKARCIRQVVLISDPKRAVKSRYGSLMLSEIHIDLVRNPLAIGLLQLDGESEPFLLVRTDRMVEEVAKSTLQVAFSFCHLPTSGLVAIYVTCQPLKDHTRMGFEEKIYGLDAERNRDHIANAMKGKALRIVNAGEGGMEATYSTVSETGAGIIKSETLIGPLCKYDVDIPYEDDCRSVLEREWKAVLAHHRSIRNPDFNAAGQHLEKLVPEDANPILPRLWRLGKDKGGDYGYLQDESGVVRGVWFKDKKKASTPVLVGTLVATYIQNGVNIDQSDLTTFQATRFSGLTVEPAEGGYCVWFPSASRR